MSEDKQPETSQPEVEQERIPEFEHTTEHPDGNNTRLKSEEIRYPNADLLYE